MDPLSALGVAAAVFQFVSFGCSLVSKGQEFYDSAGGALLKHVECDKATARLEKLARKLRLPVIEVDGGPNESQNGESSQAIAEICKNCIGIAGELRALLQRLKIAEGSKHKRWKSFHHALRSIWAQGDLDELERRILYCRRDLDSHMIADVRDGLKVLQLDQQQILQLLKDSIQDMIRTQIDINTPLKITDYEESIDERTLTAGDWTSMKNQRIENKKQLAMRQLDEAQLNVDTKQYLIAALNNNESWSNDILEKSVRLIQSEKDGNSITCERLYKAAESRIQAMQLKLLRSLKFPAMADRKETIDETHRQTFEWIFESPNARDTPRSSFVEWLQTGAGIYYMNGKAGSGKSTLMRFVHDHSATIRHLRSWSNGSSPRIGSFFFWQSGTKMQRSQLGLFRSLLYEALANDPDLVPEIFPQEWAELLSHVRQGRSIHTIEWSWSLKTLQMAFSRLTGSTTLSSKFCFFIDGLDEYEGDQYSLSQFFKNLALQPHIKLCVSSRPWLVFEDAFRICPSLRLQDLTHRDILAFARDELTENSEISLMGRSNPAQLSDLISEIADKADGVFLWVRLVVRSLLRGLQNHDDISDLRRRLDELPGDLRSLYRVMLHQIEPLYWSQASKIFQIYSVMEETQGRDSSISPVELEMAISATLDITLSSERRPMGKEEIWSRCDRMDAHLKSRCAGLLEISKTAGGYYSIYITSSEKNMSRKFLKVGYLHRTVKEFLETMDVKEILSSDTASIPDFEPNTSALMSYILRLKHSLFPKAGCLEFARNFERKDITRAAYLSLQYASRAAKSGSLVYIPIIDELETVVNGMFRGGSDSWYDLILRSEWTFSSADVQFNSSDSTSGARLNQQPLTDQKSNNSPPTQHTPRDMEFLERWKYKPSIRLNNLVTTATILGLRSYVEAKIPAYSAGPTKPLLFYALSEKACDALGTVQLLLSYGCDVNQSWEGQTPWKDFLTHVHSLAQDISQPIRPQDLEAYRNKLAEKAILMKFLLQHGASTSSTCTFNHSVAKMRGFRAPKGHTVEAVITDVFSTHLPHDAAELLYLVRIRRAAEIQPLGNGDGAYINNMYMNSSGKRNICDVEEYSQSLHVRPRLQ